MQGEAERELRCRRPSLPNRPHFEAHSIDSAARRAREDFVDQDEEVSFHRKRTAENYRRGYSLRSATLGSTAAALRAGK